MLSRSHAAFVIAAALAAAACSDDTDGSGGGGGTGGEGGAPPPIELVAGGDRPVTVLIPADNDPAVPAPLIILLHGYGATGFLENVYLELSAAALARGAIFAAPDGTRDDDDRQFWNATDACCNFYESSVDDSTYLIELVDEIASQVNVDPARVFFAGHSNGAFMSHRMACDHADRIAAFMSLSGAVHLDPGDCGASEPVSVLQIHGTDDDTISYEGGTAGPEEDAFPSVEQTLATWIEIDGCSTEPTTGEPLDLDVALAGSETEVLTYGGCDAGAVVEHWKIEGGSHIPQFYYYIADLTADWLLAHPKGG